MQVYFISLACSDSVGLFLWQFPSIMLKGPGINVKKTAHLAHISRFLVETCFSLSAWYISYFAAERAFIVLWPLKGKHISTPRNARRTIISITVILIVLKSPALWMVDWSSSKLPVLPAFKDFRQKIEPIYTKLIHTYLPVTITCVIYFILLVKVILTKIKRNLNQNKTKSKMDSLTKSVLVIFVTYVIFISPSSILILANNIKTWRRTNNFLATLVFEISVIIRTLNYSCNFVIYWFTNLQFRREAVRLLMRRNQIEPQSGSQSGGSVETRG